MSGDTRIAFERMQYCARLLRAGRKVNCCLIAKHFETSRKTILRDMTFLRDRLRYDFEFDPRANSYVLRAAPEPVL